MASLLGCEALRDSRRQFTSIVTTFNFSGSQTSVVETSPSSVRTVTTNFSGNASKTYSREAANPNDIEAEPSDDTFWLMQRCCCICRTVIRNGENTDAPSQPIGWAKQISVTRNQTSVPPEMDDGDIESTGVVNVGFDLLLDAVRSRCKKATEQDPTPPEDSPRLVVAVDLTSPILTPAGSTMEARFSGSLNDITLSAVDITDTFFPLRGSITFVPINNCDEEFIMGGVFSWSETVTGSGSNSYTSTFTCSVSFILS